MYIKNIIISGFRSYREQKFETDLSPKHNVIIGRNGSGKSNFFAAVQFVLSEKFSNLRASERHELFHVGGTRATLSVFVEIVFDNSDNRFTIPGRPDEPEIRIRRILGLKQDEFRVNDRRYSAAEVRQLLESAGFSASNPYYIVEQGKIVNLANMSEADRYDLLKDVAGTKVYEARRQESERVLEETEGRHQKIKEAIKQFDDRLKELEAETSELKNYQEADRRRKSLEYCIYTLQLNDAKGELNRLDTAWEATMVGANKNRAEETRLEKEAADAEAAAKQATRRLKQLEDERQAIEKEQAVLMARRAQIELRLRDAASTVDRDKKEREAMEKEITSLIKSVTSSKASLANKKEQRQKKQSECDKAVDRLSAMEVRLEMLQAKRGRKQQFKSKADRDKWINSEIKKNDDLIASNLKEIKSLEDEQAKCKTNIKNANTAVQTNDEAAKATEQQAATSAATRKELTTKRDTLNIERRKLWQQVSNQEGAVRRATEDYERGKARMDRATRNDIRQGLQSLREVLREQNDRNLSNSVHGQLLELLDVDPAYSTAVEMTVGNALFNVVVDSFEVSAKLLELINRSRKPGRVTFFPLDTCNSKAKEIATTADYSPLLAHVKYEKKFAPVVVELLGRTAVANTMEVGARIVKDLDCDVVTIDGDQLNRKGGITGGYFDNRNMKLVAHQEFTAASKRLTKERATLDAMCANVAAVEQEITSAMQQLENLNSQDAAARSNLETGRQDKRAQEENALRLEQQLEQLQQTIDVLKRSNTATKATNDSLKAELATEMTSNMTDAENNELEKLLTDVTATRANVTVAQSDLSGLATDVQILEDTVRHLERRLHQSQDRVLALKAPDTNEGNVAQELAMVEADLKVLEERIASADKDIVEYTKERKTLDDAALDARGKLMVASREQQREKDAAGDAQNKRMMALAKKDEAQTNIRKLGVIPPDANQYANNSVGKLMSLHKAANEELKKYAHVNKKALDQHTSVRESKANLDTELAVIDAELVSIQELMAKLDKDKGIAIERTFKQVQHNFEEVFRTIVNTEGASASLRMVENADKKAADKFVAVRIDACFGLGNPVTELAQLSGGQKSLVALSLIFAIQRCDPAPFYLFDEIDAALDAEYRTSVARMLEAQSEECQFITATFKDEMLAVADRVLGISFANKVSKVQYITKEEGKKLLAFAQQELSGKRPREDDAADPRE